VQKLFISPKFISEDFHLCSMFFQAWQRESFDTLLGSYMGYSFFSLTHSSSGESPLGVYTAFLALQNVIVQCSALLPKLKQGIKFPLPAHWGRNGTLDAWGRCLGTCCPFSRGQASLLGKFITTGGVAAAPLQAGSLNVLHS